jgi:hypothetical protein
MAFNSFNFVMCVTWGFVIVYTPGGFGMWSSLVACFAIWTTWHEGNAVCLVAQRACCYEYRALVPLHSVMMFGLCSRLCLHLLKVFRVSLVKGCHAYVHPCTFVWRKPCCWETRSLEYLSIPDLLPLITFCCCVGRSKTDLSIVSGYLLRGLEVPHSKIPFKCCFWSFAVCLDEVVWVT